MTQLTFRCLLIVLTTFSCGVFAEPPTEDEIRKIAERLWNGGAGVSEETAYLHAISQCNLKTVEGYWDAGRALAFDDIPYASQFKGCVPVIRLMRERNSRLVTSDGKCSFVAAIEKTPLTLPENLAAFFPLTEEEKNCKHREANAEKSPLLAAMMTGHAGTVEKLLSAGAKPALPIAGVKTGVSFYKLPYKEVKSLTPDSDLDILKSRAPALSHYLSSLDWDYDRIPKEMLAVLVSNKAMLNIVHKYLREVGGELRKESLLRYICETPDFNTFRRAVESGAAMGAKFASTPLVSTDLIPAIYQKDDKLLALDFDPANADRRYHEDTNRYPELPFISSFQNGDGYYGTFWTAGFDSTGNSIEYRANRFSVNLPRSVITEKGPLDGYRRLQSRFGKIPERDKTVTSQCATIAAGKYLTEKDPARKAEFAKMVALIDTVPLNTLQTSEMDLEQTGIGATWYYGGRTAASVDLGTSDDFETLTNAKLEVKMYLCRVELDEFTFNLSHGSVSGYAKGHKAAGAKNNECRDYTLSFNVKDFDTRDDLLKARGTWSMSIVDTMGSGHQARLDSVKLTLEGRE